MQIKQLTYSLLFITSFVALTFLFQFPTKVGAVTGGTLEMLAINKDVNTKIIHSTENTNGPTIDVWYGPVQRFGDLGSPQPWVNVLGNVYDPDGVSSLTYSLNGGPESNLSIGGDGFRLAAMGDFNIDIPDTALKNGQNQVLIFATDRLGNESIEPVILEYTSGTAWPQPYLINWSEVNDIQDVSQVVDGLWVIEENGLRPKLIGYDRLIAIGDEAWGDYEVQVPITMHTLDWGLVGIGLRWNGHTDDPLPGRQPKAGFVPLGAMGIYQVVDDSLGPRLQILDGDGGWAVNDTSGRKLTTNVTYIFKMRVESIQGLGGLFSFKVWEEAQQEPMGWDLTLQEDLTDSQYGSVLLVTHYIDATFGDVLIVPITDAETYWMIVDNEGGGTVTTDPDQMIFNKGDSVMLTATADPGWIFNSWTGDLTDNTNPVTVVIDDNKRVTATYVKVEPSKFKLVVNTKGDGTITLDPDQVDYTEGTAVTLTAKAAPGWVFSGWAGDLISTTNPAVVVIDSDKVVTAEFTRDSSNQAFLPFQASKLDG